MHPPPTRLRAVARATADTAADAFLGLLAFVCCSAFGLGLALLAAAGGA